MFRPSGAGKFMGCVASAYQESAFNDKTSEYAREGSAAHELAERCLKGNVDAFEFVDTTIDLDDGGEPILVDAAMCDHINGYKRYVDEVIGCDLFVEHRLDLIGILPNNGTSDAVKIDFPLKHAYVIDLKYGAGVQVFAEGNKQLMLYALGVMQSFDYICEIEEFTLAIYQPRLDHIDEFTYYRDELLAFADEVRNAIDDANAVTDDDVVEKSTPGDHCTFCTAKQTCRKFHEVNAHDVSDDFEDLTKFKVRTTTTGVTPDEISYMLTKIKSVQSWLTTIEEYALDTLSTGGVIPGWKLVEGRSNRRWTDVDDALSALKKQRTVNIDTYAPRKFITAPALEKIMGVKKFAKKFGDLITKPKGKPTIAPANDKREAIDVTADFEDLTRKEEIDNV